MLYPIQTIDEAEAVGMHSAPTGMLSVIPVTVARGDCHVIDLTHIAPVQDFSLRAFVSLTPGGVMLGGHNEESDTPMMQVSFTLRRIPITTLVIHDMATTPAPLDGGKRMLVPVPTGTAYLNVLNLIGTENAFALAKASTNDMSS